ncbi:hypothetical protein C5F49_06560 [Nitrosopumilus oxyclinae]|uniref:Uncharacterized protein n=2 Tax=Nitrosopumilus oxyclinae TaxID=1959104 RepID=A0A7D5M1Z0_9ARCH|nr:hypothetical protein C5F49_06560 [Nitrosopumilus oxyclinae]
MGLILFVSSASLAILLFLIFHPQIETINKESPILINIMFFPAMAVGFLYGIRITERAVKPSEIRSPIKRSIVKLFLFFFVIGGMFSSVNFAINGGSIMPDMEILDDGLLPWINNFITANGGATFLIITSIGLMAAATKRIVGMNTGIVNRIVTFVGTFVFFTMLVLSFTKSDPTSSGVFLYTFYQAGIVGGAFFAMNRLTKNQNMLEDFTNGY